MAITFDKILALLIAIGYVVTACIMGQAGVSGAIMLSLILLLPLTLIWNPDIGTSWPRKKTAIYTYDEPFGSGGRPRRDSHPGVVAFMGWFFLLGMPAIFYILSR